MGDIRQLAGLLEGEGSFFFHVGTPTIALSMTDLDVIEQARRWMGHTGKLMTYQPKPKNRKRRYGFTMQSKAGAGWMMTLYLLMGARRRGQIRATLAQWLKAGVRPKDLKACRAGHPFDGIRRQGKYWVRYCLACNRTRVRQVRHADDRSEMLFSIAEAQG